MQGMTHAELLKNLRGLAKALRDECTSINHGGCGVVAGIVGAHLERLGVPVEVITPHIVGNRWGGLPPAVVRATIEEVYWGDMHDYPAQPWDNAGLYRNHLALRFRSNGRTYTWDSEGTIRSATYFGKKHGQYWHRAEYKFGLGLTIQECAEMSSTREGWNSTFNRRQIPAIAALASEFLGSQA